MYDFELKDEKRVIIERLIKTALDVFYNNVHRMASARSGTLEISINMSENLMSIGLWESDATKISYNTLTSQVEFHRKTKQKAKGSYGHETILKMLEGAMDQLLVADSLGAFDDKVVYYK